jgi:hypothetical protein
MQAKCPSYYFSTNCEKGNEIWSYLYIYPQSKKEWGEEGGQQKWLVLTFDANGIVVAF